MMDAIRQVVASKLITVYHGTRTTFVPKIKSKGLTSSKGYRRAKWYMVSEDIKSAEHHAKTRSGGQPVIIEFRVPTKPKVRGGRERHMWDGYPYLWKPEKVNWEGARTRWWALRQPISPKFITRVHKVRN